MKDLRFFSNRCWPAPKMWHMYRHASVSRIYIYIFVYSSSETTETTPCQGPLFQPQALPGSLQPCGPGHMFDNVTSPRPILRISSRSSLHWRLLRGSESPLAETFATELPDLLDKVLLGPKIVTTMAQNSTATISTDISLEFLLGVRHLQVFGSAAEGRMSFLINSS